MPNIVLKIPKDAFPGAQRAVLVNGINAAAAAAEGMPVDPRKRFLCWVLVDEVERGQWTCGGADVSATFLPCMAVVHVPDGVLDATARAGYAQLLQAAFEAAMPADDPRRLATSIIFNAVADGTWAVNGAIWRLPQFAAAAGYAHLQHLSATTQASTV